MLRDRTRRSKSKLAPMAALVFAAMTGAALTAMPANAAVPTIGCATDANIFNTAYDNSVNSTGPLLEGADANWKVASEVAAPANTIADITSWSDAQVVTAADKPAPWFTPSAAAGWISHSSSGDQMALYDKVDADFFYKFDFALDSSVDATSFALNMSFYADNAVTEIYVNGVPQSTLAGGTIVEIPTGGAEPYSYHGYRQDSATNVSLNKDWAVGNNTLAVKVTSRWDKEGFGATISGNPTCLPPVVIESAQAICDDEHPKSLLITGTGFTDESTVTIGGLTAVVTSRTATTLVVTIPKLAKGWVDVAVTNGEFTVTLANGFQVGCECAEEEHHDEDGDHDGEHSGPEAPATPEVPADNDHHSSEGDHSGDHKSSEGHKKSGERKSSEGRKRSGDHDSEGTQPMTFHIEEPTSAPSSTPSSSPSQSEDAEGGDHDGSHDGEHDGEHAEEPLCEIVLAPAPAPTVLWSLAPGIQSVAPTSEPTVSSADPVVETPVTVESAPEVTEAPVAPEAAEETPAVEAPAADETPVVEAPAVDETPAVAPDSFERVAYSSAPAVAVVAAKVKAVAAKVVVVKAAKAKAAKIKAAKAKAKSAKIKALKLSKKH